jgi:hypothetical protein
MKRPSPSQFVIKPTDGHVNVIFKPTSRFYTFRVTNPDDIARFRPLSRGMGEAT